MPSALRDEIERAAWFLGSRAHFFGVSFSLRALAQYSYFRIVISLSSNGHGGGRVFKQEKWFSVNPPAPWSE
jgi:hypothetical protein